jgi:predicted nucleotidyltransferase
MEQTSGFPHEELVALCRRWHLTELTFFGSVLREDFTDASDIDVIVDFAPGHVPGFAFARLCRELEDVLGRRVDVLTRTGFTYAKESPIKRTIARTAQVYYEQPH